MGAIDLTEFGAGNEQHFPLCNDVIEMNDETGLTTEQTNWIASLSHFKTELEINSERELDSKLKQASSINEKAALPWEKAKKEKQAKEEAHLSHVWKADNNA